MLIELAGLSYLYHVLPCYRHLVAGTICSVPHPAGLSWFFVVRESEVLWLYLNCSSWLWQQNFFSSEFSGKFELGAETCTSLSCILCLEHGVIDGVANVAEQHVWSSGNRKQELFAEWHFWFTGRLLVPYLYVAYSEILICNGGTSWHMRDFPCT